MSRTSYDRYGRNNFFLKQIQNFQSCSLDTWLFSPQKGDYIKSVRTVEPIIAYTLSWPDPSFFRVCFQSYFSIWSYSCFCERKGHNSSDYTKENTSSSSYCYSRVNGWLTERSYSGQTSWSRICYTFVQLDSNNRMRHDWSIGWVYSHPVERLPLSFVPQPMLDLKSNELVQKLPNGGINTDMKLLQTHFHDAWPILIKSIPNEPVCDLWELVRIALSLMQFHLYIIFTYSNDYNRSWSRIRPSNLQTRPCRLLRWLPCYRSRTKATRSHESFGKEVETAGWKYRRCRCCTSRQ